jgi:hypothetical protein
MSNPSKGDQRYALDDFGGSGNFVASRFQFARGGSLIHLLLVVALAIFVIIINLVGGRRSSA